MRHLSERLKRKYKNLAINVYFKNSNSISNLFNDKKEKLQKNRLAGVVYVMCGLC